MVVIGVDAVLQRRPSEVVGTDIAMAVTGSDVADEWPNLDLMMTTR